MKLPPEQRRLWQEALKTQFKPNPVFWAGLWAWNSVRGDK